MKAIRIVGILDLAKNWAKIRLPVNITVMLRNRMFKLAGD
jgi:hypothetical protein